MDKESFAKCIELLEDTGRIRTEVTRTGKRVYCVIRKRENR